MQKRLIFASVVLLFLLCNVFLALGVSSQNISEKITDFNVDIVVKENSALLIRETIVYDFGAQNKHGIYRDIPLENSLEIKVKEVSDEFGSSYPFKVSKAGGYFKIKIGDPNLLISGKHTYNISYEVKNGLRFFKDHDELYWNVTGNEWAVTIQKSSVQISLPKKISKDELETKCFTGHLGSTSNKCQYQINEDGKIIFESLHSLNPLEGLTIVLGWSKGIVKEPIIPISLIVLIKQFWPVLIPLVTFIFLFKEWWQKGKDPKITKTIIAQYEPPDNLTPVQVNFLWKQRAMGKDISATLIALATKGYLKIREIKKSGIFKSTDYELIKLKDFFSPKENLWEHEKSLLKNIFESKDKVLISDLKNKFYKHLKTIINKVSSELTLNKYFVSDPKKIVSKWVVIGIILTAFSPLASLAEILF